MAGDDWSREEVEATVGDYFAMLESYLAGEELNKSAHSQNLRRLLQGRSTGSVDFKHGNISAVLVLHGYPYLKGFKPAFNFQRLLEQVVLEYLDIHVDFFETLATGPKLEPKSFPDVKSLDPDHVVEEPPESMPIPQAVWSANPGRAGDYVSRDAANRQLGRNGESFVMEFERKRLLRAGRADLVSRIEWTADVRGDGAGYDIHSFNADESSRLIEVKTTGLDKYFPFLISANELRCSIARPHEFHLYRVFNFGADARLYVLPGEVSRSCLLDPTQYRAFIQAK